ncbi:UNVERIFIED_CONTAM: hypothetical protein PYX00_000869 [Menopon gallinae]|uniref:Uncharacterized protein n=1 Tax=Menopon gallinae TaxID=328185 RepID=A0AAW2IAR5_9NEOP
MAESEEAQNTETNGVEELDVSATTKKARDVVAEIEAEELKELEEIRKKQRDPPIVFRDVLDVKVEFDSLVGLIDGKLNPDEQRSMEELHMYMLENEGSWALGDGFLNFIGRLLNDKSLSPDVRIRTLNILACAALKDDVILLLHQDRREHIMMNYAGDVERLTPEEQQSLSLFFANLFEHMSSSEWLLYISEWQHQNNNLSNIRVTTKVGVNALLSENPKMQDYGSAIIHNMACKEKMHQNKRLRRILPPGCVSKVFDDVAIELTMALLQFLNNKPNEELLFRTMKSLARLCQISGQDVSQMIQMIGPEPSKFKGVSTRIDEQITQITQKLR